MENYSTEEASDTFYRPEDWPTAMTGQEPAELIAECDSCGDDIREGESHECPVLGTTVSIERRDA